MTGSPQYDTLSSANKALCELALVPNQACASLDALLSLAGVRDISDELRGEVRTALQTYMRDGGYVMTETESAAVFARLGIEKREAAQSWVERNMPPLPGGKE